jgi:hypothetical protein
MQQVKSKGLRVIAAGDRRKLASPASTKPKLLDRMREAMRSRHYSRSTRQSYWNRVKRFIFFHNVLNRGGRVVRSPVDCL